MFKIPTILTIVSSYGGGVYYGGDYGGGYGSGYNEGSSGVLSGITTLLDSLPTPVATIIVCAAVILLATLVGKIVARVFANIFYPDPEKPSIFTKKQKLMFLGGFCVAFAVIIFSLTYQPKQLGDAVNVDNFGDGEFGMQNGEDYQPDGENFDEYNPDENYTEGDDETTNPDEEQNPPTGGTVAVNPLLRGAVG